MIIIVSVQLTTSLFFFLFTTSYVQFAAFYRLCLVRYFIISAKLADFTISAQLVSILISTQSCTTSYFYFTVSKSLASLQENVTNPHSIYVLLAMYIWFHLLSLQLVIYIWLYLLSMYTNRRFYTIFN